MCVCGYMCVRESACVCELLFATEQFLKIAFRDRQKKREKERGEDKGHWLSPVSEELSCIWHFHLHHSLSILTRCFFFPLPPPPRPDSICLHFPSFVKSLFPTSLSLAPSLFFAHTLPHTILPGWWGNESNNTDKKQNKEEKRGSDPSWGKLITHGHTGLD